MAEIQDFVGTWRSKREWPFSTQTFTWVASDDGLRGEWTIESAGTPVPGQARGLKPPRCHQMQIGTPVLDNRRALFSVNAGPFLTEFRLVGEGEALLGAAVDKLPPEFAGPEHQRSIEGHRVRLRKVAE